MLFTSHDGQTLVVANSGTRRYRARESKTGKGACLWTVRFPIINAYKLLPWKVKMRSWTLPAPPLPPKQTKALRDVQENSWLQHQGNAKPATSSLNSLGLFPQPTHLFWHMGSWCSSRPSQRTSSHGRGTRCSCPPHGHRLRGWPRGVGSKRPEHTRSHPNLETRQTVPLCV